MNYLFPYTLAPRPAPPGTQAWFAAEQVYGAQRPARQPQPWFSEVTMSCEPEYLTIKRWAPMVRVVYDYYPFGLSWENPKLPNDPEGVHDHAYQDKEFQFAEFSTGHGLALYDFHARMYDPATGRWLVPDPAEQFSNPYLAMANNPVSYVDPDGKIAFVIVGAVVGAYIGGAMANDHLNPGQWNFQDPNTWIGIGVGGTIGAFGGHGLMAAKGKAAFAGMNKGSAAAKAGGKKFFGSTVGGTTNAISNYDGADSFGWGTLADFGAGFAGSYVGLSTKSWAAGFNAGGFANAVSNIAQDGFGSAYEFAQDWVGGGLSSLVGMSYGMPKVKPPVGQKATLKSFGKSFAKYSGQSAMWDFAYTKQEDFANRNLGQILTLYAVGGALGASVDMLKFMSPLDGSRRSQSMTKAFKGILNASIAFTELRMTSQIKGKAGKPKEQPTKLGVLGTKWLFNFGGF